MRSTLKSMIVKVAVVCLFALASASDVLEFTDASFASKIAEHDVILVEFFAPWCGHCKKLAPEYERAATSLKSDDPPVPLAKVDCTANTEVCGKYGVGGYPTLKIFKGGEMSEDYNGPRDADGIVKTMRSKAGPASRQLNSIEDADKFTGISEYGVIGFFESDDSEVAKTFQKVASSMSSDMRFAHTSNKDILSKYGYKDDIVLFQPERLHSKFEDPKKKYNDDLTVFKIKNWIVSESVGLCGHRTTGSVDKFKNPLVVVYYDVDYVKNVKGTNYWRNRVMKVAKAFKDSGKLITFAVSNYKDLSRELDEFGVKNPSVDKPSVTGRDSKKQKFVMSAEFSIENLEKFANDLLDGKLEPYMKSEPVPASQEAVKVAVAKNFNEIVAEDKDVLIEFYAPWCGHCKQLEPKYKELAEKLADEPEVVIAKMDATANDVPPQYEVQGFPTIYYKPKGSSPRKYDGGREVADFVKYLSKEATSELKSYSRDGKKKKTDKKEEL